MISLQDIEKYTKEMTLLYVEDNEITREATILIFKDMFKETIIAEDGVQGLELYRKYKDKIGIIISDINMPHKDGLDMSMGIKSINKDIPILIFSAHNESQYFTKAISLDIDAYLLKPLQIDQFIQSLGKVIEKIILIKENQKYKQQLEKKVEIQGEEIVQKTQELNLFKDEIITIFTHELKTPLNAIIAYGDYIKRALHKGNLSPKKIEKLANIAEKIYSNGIIQENMIKNILEAGRIKTGQIKLNKTMLNIPSIIKPIIQSYKEAYEREVWFDEIDKNLNILIDEKYFVMIFTNVYSNALKYSKSTVKITCKQDDTSYKLIIEDDGNGIEPSQREKIFDMFEQLDTTVLKREKKGTGIGLFTVKHLAKLCGIGIEVGDSELLDGAKFTLVMSKE